MKQNVFLLLITVVSKIKYMMSDEPDIQAACSNILCHPENEKSIYQNRI